MTRKNNLSVIFYTHNTFSEGGRKMHVYDYDAQICLCGYTPGLFFEADLPPNTDLVGYISQPDPDRNICRRCRTAALKKNHAITRNNQQNTQK